MSFLLGDDYASSSGSDEDEKNEELKTDHSEKKDFTSENQFISPLLPSAESVLSSVSASTASFLPPKFNAKAQKALKPYSLLDAKTGGKSVKEIQGAGGQNHAEIAETSKSDYKRRPSPQVAIQEHINKRGRINAKERVKNQRLKGQAGIGSDFCSWKSDAAMALRQHFD
ncbi:hypothetical protein CCR75_008618 [Bremia lactucae]|uniref:Uncharacterized protein n=1 Tax=Bremia lactucae TaxID=4779 RepID=A0A976IKM7_BRELC|nr:hypothetical protein CCR75_008618 [Bremia lactucae]